MGSIEPWAHESRSANSSDSEATAGVEPAMKVLQTSR